MANIWGKGGLFEQRIQQKMELAERSASQKDVELAQGAMDVGIRQQNANTNQYNAQTTRLAEADPATAKQMRDGVRSFAGAGKPLRVLGSDGKLMGLRGSSVGSPSTGGAGLRRLTSYAGKVGGTQGSTTGDPMADREGYALGGMVGDPRKDDGTDKVPAMLREGEYVLTPQAAQKIGIRKLDKLNESTTGVDPRTVRQDHGMRRFQYGGQNGPNADKIALEEAKRRAAERLAAAKEASEQTVRGNPGAAEMNDASRQAYEETEAKRKAKTGSGRGQGARTTGGKKAWWKPAGVDADALRKQGRMGRFAGASVDDGLRAVGRGAKGLAKTATGVAGKVATPIAATASSIGSLNTDTTDWGFDPATGFWDDVGKRTFGTMADLGNTLTFGVADRLGNLATGDGFVRSPNYRDDVALPASSTAAAAPQDELQEIVPQGQRIELTPEEQRMLDDRNVYFEPGGQGIPKSSAVGKFLQENSMAADPFGEVDAGRPMDIPGSGVQYAGNYGGQEVIREDIDGVPTFTGLRTPEQVLESRARSEAEQQPEQITPDGLRGMALQIMQDAQGGGSRYTTRAMQQANDLLREATAMENAAVYNKDVSLRNAGATTRDFDDGGKDLQALLTPMLGEEGYGRFLENVAANYGIDEAGNSFLDLPQAAQLGIAADYLPQNVMTQRVLENLQGAENRPSFRGLLNPSDVGARQDAQFFRDWSALNPDSSLSWNEALMGDMRPVNVGGKTYFVPADAYDETRTGRIDLDVE